MARRRAGNQGCSGETPGAHRSPVRAARPSPAGTPRARGPGGGGGGRVGGGRAGLPSSADFMVPPAGGAGPKVSPLPQTAAGGPSGNLEGTGKLVIGIHAAAAARGGRRGHSRPGRAPGDAGSPRNGALPGVSAARPAEMSSRGGGVRAWRARLRPGTREGRRGGKACARVPAAGSRAATVPASPESQSLALTQGRALPPAFLKLENTSPASRRPAAPAPPPCRDITPPPARRSRRGPGGRVAERPPLPAPRRPSRGPRGAGGKAVRGARGGRRAHGPARMRGSRGGAEGRARP